MFFSYLIFHFNLLQQILTLQNFNFSVKKCFIQYSFYMVLAQEITLPDLFMLFIYVEIIGVVGAFYSTNRIPFTLPIIVAITALCRLIVMQSKEMDALVVLGEAGAILVLSIAAFVMSLKDKVSLEKIKEFEKELNQ